jgi:hypothetical protein
MRLVVLAVVVWGGILGSLGISGWLVRRWFRRPTVDQAPVSDRWLADHGRNTTGDRS